MKFKTKSPWSWIPTLYFAEGIPYVIVMTLAGIMYKRMGISNTDIALYTSWLYLPWVLKPLWSPVVDMFKTKRLWIIAMQLLIGAGMAGVAFTIPVDNFFQWTLAFLWLLAFSSATHDIAADGFYMLGLNEHEQTFFVGIRSTFYRLAMLTGQGLLVILAGYFESSTGLPNVELEFSSSPKTENIVYFSPDSIKFNKSENLFLVAKQFNKSISLKNISKHKSDSIINLVNNWNIKNRFYSNNLEASDGETSWWMENISQPLKNYLKSHFGKHKDVVNVNQEGNIGLVYFHLSKKPDQGEKLVLNFVRISGDNSFKIIEGNRFEFDANNWNKPAFSIIQIDRKLRIRSLAKFEVRSGNIPLAWSFTFIILSCLFILFVIYHKIFLPKSQSDVQVVNSANPFKEFIKIFGEFFKKKNIGISIAFLLLYRLSESQIIKLASLFLLDSKASGGLGLTTGEVGLVYGTVGLVSLTIGGILGGVLASRNGLKYWIWWMAFAINLPNFVYVIMSYIQPESFFTISVLVGIEQFGYGFGFTAYMLYMIYISKGKHKTAHFAITTAFMALGMMIPGMVSGWIQDIIGYQSFFVWVIICTIPIFILLPFMKFDKDFGKKSKNI